MHPRCHSEQSEESTFSPSRAVGDARPYDKWHRICGKREGTEPLPYGKSFGFVVAINRRRGLSVFYVYVTYWVFITATDESVGDGAHDIPRNSLRQKSKIFATSLAEGGLGCVFPHHGRWGTPAPTINGIGFVENGRGQSPSPTDDRFAYAIYRRRGLSLAMISVPPSSLFLSQSLNIKTFCVRAAMTSSTAFAAALYVRRFHGNTRYHSFQFGISHKITNTLLYTLHNLFLVVSFVTK